MKLATHLLLAALGLVMVAAVGCSEEQGLDHDEKRQAILALMPGESVTADVMGVAPDPEVLPLVISLNETISTADWIGEYFEATAPDGPFPYDARFGLSEAEFEAVMLALDGTAIDTTQISSKEGPNGFYTLFGRAPDGALDGFVLNLDSLQFETPYGVTGAPERHTDFEPGGTSEGWKWEIPLGEDGGRPEGAGLLFTLASRSSDDRVRLKVIGVTYDDGRAVRYDNVDLVFEPVG